MNTIKEITKAVLNMVHGLHDKETVRLDFCRKALDFKREIAGDEFSLSYCVVDADTMQKTDSVVFFACHFQKIESSLLLSLPEVIDSFEKFITEEAFARKESVLRHERQTNNTMIHDHVRQMLLDWADDLIATDSGEKLPDIWDLRDIVYNSNPQYIYHHQAERDLSEFGAVAWIAEIRSHELDIYGEFSPLDFDNPADCANLLLYILGDKLLANLCEKSAIVKNMLGHQHVISKWAIETLKREIHKHINDFDMFD